VEKCTTYGKIIMRPKGKKDSRKRKVKKFLSRLEEIQAIEKYREGLSLKNLSEHYDISKSALSALFKRRNIKC
jgi:YesN/AraC family two-component response regulator